MSWSAPVGLAAVLLLAACDGKVLVIESDTSWEGSISYGGPIEGSGNASIDLSDVPTDVCWVVKKTTELGTLRVYLEDENWFGLTDEVDGDQTTSEPEGEVQGCNE